MSVRLSTCPPVRLFVCLSVYLSVCFVQKLSILSGSKPQIIENDSGLKADLRWFYVIMSLHSLVSIILGTSWTMDSIEKQTNWAVAKLVFLPLFFYRMFAWLIIITFLQIFSVVVLGGMAMVNGLVFLLAHDPDKVEPIVQTFLSHLSKPHLTLPTYFTIPEV